MERVRSQERQENSSGQLVEEIGCLGAVKVAPSLAKGAASSSSTADQRANASGRVGMRCHPKELAGI